LTVWINGRKGCSALHGFTVVMISAFERGTKDEGLCNDPSVALEFLKPSGTEVAPNHHEDW
jgi:hypothetical protein